ncbi:hypothetical protein HUN08_05825 [Gordonia sp. X0973]|uniref:hypothetical protein n=1 Tax=Gordonia sp. X0973 TaxID=2742602 RepID=UPI000F5357C0|nr:hypothetical protein [Gordonia sp. X0973]QKT06767.1 hypothetical protein HUN08_05825 [Gordonia sp. X0973]
MTVSPNLRRLRVGIAAGGVAATVLASLVATPIASAKPLGAPILGSGSTVVGNGCTYALGVKVAPAKRLPPTLGFTVLDDKPNAQKRKDDGKGWVTFWETKGVAKPGSRGSKRIGRAKPDAKGLAVIAWTPGRIGASSVWAYQGSWSAPLPVTVVAALPVWRICLMSQ